jgi:hypothetical protein
VVVKFFIICNCLFWQLFEVITLTDSVKPHPSGPWRSCHLPRLGRLYFGYIIVALSIGRGWIGYQSQDGCGLTQLDCNHLSLRSQQAPPSGGAMPPQKNKNNKNYKKIQKNALVWLVNN